MRVEPQQHCADVRSRAKGKIADIEHKMRTLTAMKTILRSLVEQCENCASDDCPILASMEQESSLT